ncbi:hypothetical protein PR048_015972 [Dryococelus australis]|uniref:Uncharacterized protein n=1 Tax=Dryococelus australis TaxID=614101 RepID=A0ABQ9HIF1_9NEOP|nr:hypothetical protein PR048_015972 [Dryococelus australis]
MWCAVLTSRIVGRIFFGETVNTVVWRHIFNKSVEKIDDVDFCFLDDRVIFKDVWPPRSPHLSSPVKL